MASSIFAGTGASFNQNLNTSDSPTFDGLTLDDGLTIDGTLGSEQFTNPGFTGSATGWTLGAGWAYSANTIVHTPGSTAAFSQNPAGAIAVEIGKVYYVEIQQSAASTGETAFSFGGVDIFRIAGEDGADTSAVAVRAASTAGLIGTPDTDYDGTITLVSAKEIPAALTLNPLGAGDPGGLYVEPNSGGATPILWSAQGALLRLSSVARLSSQDGTQFSVTDGFIEAGAGMHIDGSVQPVSYLAADESPGISTTVTTASLEGKTLTFKDGLVTGFA